jgi:hypothetical protein
MNYYETLAQLAAKHPRRQSGSPGVAAVMEAIKTLAAAWKITPETNKVSVYQFQQSVWGLIAIGLLLFLSGFVIPVLSLGGAVLMGALLLRELSRPLLGKAKAIPAENLLVNLPAKNKEAQKVFLVASCDTDPFIKTPFECKPGRFIIAIFSMIALMTGMSILYLGQLGTIFNCLNLFFLILLAVVNLMVKEPQLPSTTLKNIAAILETAAILNKVKPDITSVALCFCGSRSLNSGMIAFGPEFAKGPEDLTYVVNLVETDDSTVTALQCLTVEGMFPLKNTSPILLGLLQEVAREKALTPLTTANTSEYTETYPLNRAKIQPITIVIPQNESIPLRDVRELLCGLIRKLDH